MKRITDEAAEYNAHAWDSFRRQRDQGRVDIRQDPTGEIRTRRYRMEPVYFELAGDVTGKRLLDLGCGEGAELLTWANEGAEVVGVDVSSNQIKAARRFARDLGLPCTFYQADLLTLPEELLQGTFDIVFTSWVTVWIGDLDTWFKHVNSALKQGGILILNGAHPLTAFTGDRDEGERETYFETGPFEDTSSEPGGWNPAGDTITTIEWSHTLGNLVTAVAHAGLRVTDLLEMADRKGELANGLPQQFILRAIKG